MVQHCYMLLSIFDLNLDVAWLKEVHILLYVADFFQTRVFYFIYAKKCENEN